MTIMMGPAPPSLRDAPAVAELFVGVFRRDLLSFYPQSRFAPGRGRTTSIPVRTSSSSRSRSPRSTRSRRRSSASATGWRRVAAAGSRRTTGG
jgi:hypothetical protein